MPCTTREGGQNESSIFRLESHTLEHGKVYEVLSEEDGWYE